MIVNTTESNNSRMLNLFKGLNQIFILIICFLLLTILSLNFSFAQLNAPNPPSGGAVFSGPQSGEFSGGYGGSYVFSNPQYAPVGFQGQGAYYSYYGITPGEYQEICRERQDFIVQIPPGGCAPVVVRSDLLAEQNVSVFCKLQAIQINPFVQTEYIKNIGFTHRGSLPDGVAGVSYYRPRISLSPRINSQGFPTIDNIGYAVIILKRNSNENNLSEFVSGNLTARITYDVPTGFGAGINELTVPVLDDQEWSEDYTRYGFFDGKGFVRVDRVGDNFADVSVYIGENQRVSSIRLEKGRASSEAYLPGFYCNAAYKLTLVDNKPATTMARISINGDSYDVYKDEVFANGLCRVRDIKSYGFGYGSVSLVCNGKPFNVELGYKNANFEINEIPETYNLGNTIYTLTQEDKENKVYFASVERDSAGVYTAVLLMTDKNFDEELKNKLAEYLRKNTGSESFTEGKILKIKSGETGIFEGSAGDGKSIKFIGFTGSEDVNSGDGEFENSFLSAIDSYKEVDSEFSGVNDKLDQESIGKKSLTKGIKLSTGKNKDKTILELSDILKEKYGIGSSSISSDDLNFDNSNAVYILDTGNIFSIIQLEDIREPSFDERGIELLVDGAERKLSEIDEFIVPKDDKGAYIQLKSFDEEGINIEAKCLDSEGKVSETISGNNGRINFRAEKVICNNNIFVREIHLIRNAKIKLEPINRNVGSEVNVSYSIGIEKRAIELSPAKTSEKIKRLNQSINEWQNISDKLGKTVKTMKAACFATSAALQVKNLFSNLGGKAIARTEVMRGTGGWNDMCAEAIANGGTPKQGSGMASGPYNSLDDCYRKNNDLIEKDVSSVSDKINSINSEIKTLENAGGFVNEGKGIFGGKSIDYNGARNSYYTRIKTDLSGKEIAANNGKEGNELDEIEFDDVFTDKLKAESVSYEQLREIKLYSDLAKDSGSSPVVKNLANKELYDLLNQVEKLKEYDEAKSLAEDSSEQLNGIGKLGVDTPYLQEGQQPRSYYGFKADLPNDDINEPVPLHLIYSRTGTPYYVVLTKIENNKYTIDKNNIYQVNGDKSIGTKVELIDEELKEYSSFILRDAGTYQNQYKNPEVRYYETEPYKGMPSIVPLDLKEGWYAGTKQTLPTFGDIKAFEDSGRVSSFWLCNVGSNGREEFSSGLGDDECEMFNVYTGQSLSIFPGLPETKTKELTSRAINAIERVASQYSPGIQRVNVPGVGSVKVGNPAVNLPGTQCQDFMSPKDCQFMFNVCDPVICPSSRCNLGGKYYASDVIQTGIVGGIFMCLPNYKEGILIPVCLTGIHAGLDNYISILKSSRDCLQENLNSGEYVGICDEITAIYTCEFFWRQISPATNIILPKLLEKASGQGTRGGGEYLSVQSSWQNMQNSIDYFKNYYGVNSLKAFRARSTDETGSAFCKAFISTKYPNKFKTLIEPDSPTQFSAWFTEIKQSDATVPAISQYKVFYHIFAGNDIGAQYTIYLKDSSGESFFQSGGNVHVATGFIGRGEYVSEARDFTAPSNYKQLCVRINNQEECGFKQVSTSFALNYLRDSYINNQLTENQITTSKQCVSGTPDPLALINPNIQSGVEEATLPQIYNSGIIRVCATSNPGSNTDPERWQRMGYCDDSKIGCWLDRESVGRAVTNENEGIRNKTISELDSIKAEIENEGKKIADDFTLSPIFLDLDRKVSELEVKAFSYSGEEEVNFDNSASEVNNLIRGIEDKYVLTTDQQGLLLYYQSRVYGAIAENDWINKKKIESEKREEAAEAETPVTPEEPVEEEVTTPELSTLNERILFACSYFNGKGYSDIHTSAIIGNLLQESSTLNPEQINKMEGAYGIAQWRLDRRTNLDNFAKSQNKSVNDFQTQLDFIIHELQGSGAYGGGSKKSVDSAFKRTETITDATRVFMNSYEVADSSSFNSRVTKANEVNDLCFSV